MVVVSIGINTKNAFAQNDQWLNWEDPDKEFSLQYPSDWTVRPRENRFEEQDISFYIDGDFTTLTNLTTLGIDVYNTTSTDLKELMEQAVESASTNPNNILINTKLFEGPEYVKYTVSGKPAASVIWLHDNHDNPLSGQAVYLFIASIVGDKFVRINYNSYDKQFDKYLPEVEKVVQSIKVK